MSPGLSIRGPPLEATVHLVRGDADARLHPRLRHRLQGEGSCQRPSGTGSQGVETLGIFQHGPRFHGFFLAGGIMAATKRGTVKVVYEMTHEPRWQMRLGY